jgi:pimeloyl-ACP methyl ester carboxylesterase
VERLAEELDVEGWSLVQLVMSSSYLQFGISSLDTDAEELNMLIDSLKQTGCASQVVIAGHSTGCQDAVHYARKHPGRLDGVILQAPVSDRECMFMEAGTASKLALAEEMIAADRGEELMPRASFYAPITARRFQSLAGRLGDDDLFRFAPSLLEHPTPRHAEAR